MAPQTISDYVSPAMSMLGLKENILASGREAQEYAGDIGEWGTDYKGKLSAGRQIGGWGVPVGLYAISRATGVPIDVAWYVASSFFGSLFGGEVAEQTAPPPPAFSNYDIDFGMQDIEQLEQEKSAIESTSDWEYDAMDAINRAIQVYTLGRGGKGLGKLDSLGFPIPESGFEYFPSETAIDLPDLT